MRLSLRARFIRKLMMMSFKKTALSYREARERGAKSGAAKAYFEKIAEIERIDIQGIPAAWIRPRRRARSGASGRASGNVSGGAGQNIGAPVLLHLHGGGYVSGTIDSYLPLCVPMARGLDVACLFPEYRLAPEHPYPAALEDALSAYRWLLAQGFAAAKIVVSGDSAGGGLALALVLALRDSGEAPPAAVACMSPWTDLTNRGSSRWTHENRDPLLTKETLDRWAACYASASDLVNPLVSPAYADFRRFPPLLIQVGSEEILLDDAFALAEKAKAAGVDVELELFEDLWHVWQILGELLPESRRAFESLSRFVEAKTAIGSSRR